MEKEEIIINKLLLIIKNNVKKLDMENLDVIVKVKLLMETRYFVNKVSKLIEISNVQNKSELLSLLEDINKKLCLYEKSFESFLISDVKNKISK